MSNRIFSVIFLEISQKLCIGQFASDSVVLINGRKFDVDEKLSDDVFYISNDSTRFLLYRCFRNIWQVIDPQKQFVSGLYKDIEDYYEIPGFFINDDNKTMCFRIAKNASSVISYAYLGRTFGENDSRYKHLDEIDFSKYGDYTKFFVWRDPIDRFNSSISHIYRHKWHYNDFSNLHKNLLLNNEENITVFFARIYEILNVCKDLDEEVHIAPQWIQLKKVSHVKFDHIIDIENLESFMKKFNMTFKKVSVSGFNDGFKSNVDAKIFVNDYEYRRQNSEVIYNGNSDK